MYRRDADPALSVHPRRPPAGGLQGIRDSIVRVASFNHPIGLLKAVGRTVETNVPRKVLPDLADAATHITRRQTYGAGITHPLVDGTYDSRGSIQRPDVPAIRNGETTPPPP